VEVHGEEIVVTFPYPFLRDKLGDPQRRMEIQEALSEVIGGKCRIKLVLASEYIPQQPAKPQPQPAEPAPSKRAAAESELDEQELESLHRWAEKVGGQVVEENDH